MKFDAQGVHQWTHQRGGEGWDYAHALQAEGVSQCKVFRFRICSVEASFRTWGGRCSESCGSASPVGVNLFGAFTSSIPSSDDFRLWTKLSKDRDHVHNGLTGDPLGTWKLWGMQLLTWCAQVDANGSAWVAGLTTSSLDGQSNNKVGHDIFLMKFDAQGLHQWTRQRGDQWEDKAYSLQVAGVWRSLFWNLFHGAKLQKKSCVWHCHLNGSNCCVPSQGRYPVSRVSSSDDCRTSFKIITDRERVLSWTKTLLTSCWPRWMVPRLTWELENLSLTPPVNPVCILGMHGHAFVDSVCEGGCQGQRLGGWRD